MSENNKQTSNNSENNEKNKMVNEILLHSVSPDRLVFISSARYFIFSMNNMMHDLSNACGPGHNAHSKRYYRIYEMRA